MAKIEKESLKSWKFNSRGGVEEILFDTLK